MAWPNSPLTSYVSNSLPVIKASDLNNFQSAINQVWGVQFGDFQYQFSEDFDTNPVTLTPNGTTQVVTDQLLMTGASSDSRLKINDASPATGSTGLARFDIVGAGSGAQILVNSVEISVGTRDFVLSCRARVQRANIDALAQPGFGFGITGGAGFAAGGGGGETTWYAADGTTNHPSGVTITNGQMYRFRVVRISGVSTWTIDDVQVLQQADTLNLSAKLYITQDTSAGAASEAAAVDYLKFGCGRP